MNDIPDLMTSPTLTITLDQDPTKFRIAGGTYMHKDRIASIPGSRFVGQGKDYWTIPRTWPAMKLMVRLFQGTLDWSPEAAEYASALWTGLVEPSLDLRNNGAKPEWIEALSKNLPDGILAKPYQISGALYLATARRAMLFDEQGTGKMTQTALTLSLYPDTLPALIISPKAWCTRGSGSWQSLALTRSWLTVRQRIAVRSSKHSRRSCRWARQPF